MAGTRQNTLRASSALAVATTEYGTYGITAKVSSTATSTSANKLVDTAGNFIVNGVAVGDIIKNTTTGKYALVTAVDSATQLSVGADVFLSTNAYSLYDGTQGFTFTNFDKPVSELVAVLDVSAAATDVGDTLDVYIDTSFDAGLSWVNLGHFTQVLGNGGAKKFVMSFRHGDPGASAVFAVSADAAAGATRQLGIGDRVRHRSAVVDASTQNVSFTHSIKIFTK